MSSRDLAMMVLLVGGTPMNLPSMMIESVVGRLKEKAYLPYDMIFTLLFINVGIDLDGEDPKSLTHTNYYTIQSLHWIKFGKKIINI